MTNSFQNVNLNGFPISSGGGVGGGTSGILKSAMLDVGSLPKDTLSISVSDIDITSSSQVIGWIDLIGTGKDIDEMEMDRINLTYYPTTGTIHLIISGHEGYIHDKFNFNYFIV